MDPQHPDLFEYIRVAQESFPTREAYKPSNISSYITYEEAFERLLAFADRLKPYCLVSTTGDQSPDSRQARLAVLLNNCPAYLNCFWSAAALRAIVTALNNRYVDVYTQSEIWENPPRKQFMDTIAKSALESEMLVCVNAQVVWKRNRGIAAGLPMRSLGCRCRIF
jgi:acyl-CoA synthetase (AMP-forming)/AMP-acid ligase II